MLKYYSILTSIICIFRESDLYSQLEENCVFNNGNKYVIYGDPAYPLTELLCPFPTNRLTQEQQNFNFKMSTVR